MFQSNFSYKFATLGFFYIVAKAGIVVTLGLEYDNRHKWLSMNFNTPKSVPDVNIFWSRLMLAFLCGCFMPILVLNKQTTRTCLSIWNTNKTPQDVPSTFPTVAYTQRLPTQTVQQNMVRNIGFFLGLSIIQFHYYYLLIFRK